MSDETTSWDGLNKLSKPADDDSDEELEVPPVKACNIAAKKLACKGSTALLILKLLLLLLLAGCAPTSDGSSATNKKERRRERKADIVETKITK